MFLLSYSTTVAMKPKRNNRSLFNALRYYVPGLEKVKEGNKVIWRTEKAKV